MAVDAHGMPVRAIIIAGTTADCTQAEDLIAGIDADYVFADKAYDTNAFLQLLADNQTEPVIPSKSNRSEKRQHDEYLYRFRHLVENAILHLKQWRGIATRYAKRAESFLAAVQIRCLAI